MNEKLKQLHQALTEQGFAVPTDYGTFERTLQDPEKSKAFHQKLVDSGFSVPTDYTQFTSVLGLGEKKKETPAEVGDPGGTPSSAGSSSHSKSVDINLSPEQLKTFQEAVTKTPEQVRAEQERKRHDESQAFETIKEAAGENKESNPFVTFGKSAWNMLAYQLPSSLAAAASTMAEPHESFSNPAMLTKQQEANIKRTKANLLNFAIKHGEETTKDLVSSLDKVKDPIDALNWVSYAMGQAAAQIPAAVASGGTTSIGQEVGSIYLDGIKKIAADNKLSVEQVIEKKLDHPAAAVAMGTAAGLLDYVGASKVLKVPKESLVKSLRRRALDITKAGATEAGTEYSQTWIEQIGKGQVAGDELAKTWDEANTSQAARERLESAAQGLVGGAGLHSVHLPSSKEEGEVGKNNVQPKPEENASIRSASAVGQQSIGPQGVGRRQGSGVEPGAEGNQTSGESHVQEKVTQHRAAPESGSPRTSKAEEEKIDQVADKLRFGEKFSPEEKKIYDSDKEKIQKRARERNVAELPFTTHEEEPAPGEEFTEEVQHPVQQPQEKPTQPAAEKSAEPSKAPAEPVAAPEATPPSEPTATKEEVPVNNEGKQKLLVYGTLKEAHTRGEAFNGIKLKAEPIELKGDQVEHLKGYPELEESKQSTVKADVLEVTPKELEEAKNWEKAKYNLDTIKLPSGENAYVFHLKPEAKAQVDKTDIGKPLESRGGIPLHEFERHMEPFKEGQRFKIYEHTLNLIHKYNPQATVGQGHTGRKAKGLFYEYTKNIRLKGLNDLSVALHELTHALDKGHGVIKKFVGDTRFGDPLRRSLNRLFLEYYPNAKPSEEVGRKATEGYATLVQKFLESPTEIKQKYPELVDAFLKPDAPYGFPALQEFLKDAQSVIQQYQNLTPLDKIGARVVDNRIDEVSPTNLNRYDKITQELFDRLDPIEKLDEQMGRNMTSSAVHLWMRLSNNAMQLAEKNTTSNHNEFWQMSDKGEWNKKLDYNFNTLIKDLDKRGAQVDFSHYLVARRVHEQYQALHQMQADLKAHPEQALELQPQIEALEDLLHKDAIGEKEAEAAFQEGQKMFKEDEKRFDALMAENLEFLHNPMVQLLDKEGYDKLKDVKGYAPFKRQFYDELTGDLDTPVMMSGKTRVGSLMGRHGSSKPIVNPLISAMQLHSEVLRKGMKQMVYNKILDIAKEHPTLFQEMPYDPAQERSQDILMARRDYKKVPLLVNRDIKAVIDENYQFHNMHLLEQVGIAMSQLFRTGTTGIYWQFFVNNTFLDQMAATVNTQNGMMPFWSSAKEAIPAMANLASERIFGKAIWFPNSMEAAYLKEYLFLAGSTQTFLNADITNRHNMEKTVMGGSSVTFGKRVADYFSFLVQLLSVPGNVTEIATRFTEYSLARKAGKSQVVALEEAGRVSAPFHHQGRLGGQLGRSYVRTVPYFNSSLQVLRQMGRSLKTEEGRKRYAFVTLSMMAASAGAMLALLHKNDDDEQKQILKTLTPDEMSKYLYFPNPYSDKRLIKVRIPEQMGAIVALQNMMLIRGADQTNYKWSEWGEAGASFLPTQLNPFNPMQMLFSYIPPAPKTAIETVAGFKTYPNVRSIETERDKLLPPSERFNKYSSPVAIFLGHELDWSPKKIDHFLEGTLGRSVKYVTGKPNTYNVQDVFAKEMYFEASRQVQLYYNVKERNAQQVKAFEMGLRDYDKDQENLLYQREDLLIDIETAMQEYKEINEDENKMEATRVRNEIFVMLRQLENLEK